MFVKGREYVFFMTYCKRFECERLDCPAHGKHADLTPTGVCDVIFDDLQNKDVYKDFCILRKEKEK